MGSAGTPAAPLTDGQTCSPPPGPSRSPNANGLRRIPVALWPAVLDLVVRAGPHGSYNFPYHGIVPDPVLPMHCRVCPRAGVPCVRSSTPTARRLLSSRCAHIDPSCFMNFPSEPAPALSLFAAGCAQDRREAVWGPSPQPLPCSHEAAAAAGGAAQPQQPLQATARVPAPATGAAGGRGGRWAGLSPAARVSGQKRQWPRQPRHAGGCRLGGPCKP